LAGSRRGDGCGHWPDPCRVPCLLSMNGMCGYGRSVDGRAAVVLYVLGLVVAVVGVDILFFRHQIWPRLMVNVGIVLVFAAFYLRFQAAFGGK